MAPSRCANTAGPRKTKAGWRRAGRCAAGRGGDGAAPRSWCPRCGRRSPGAEVWRHGALPPRHSLRWSRQLPACTAWAHCAGTTTTRTLHRGVGKKSVQHRMTEPILCREWRSVHSLNNYYWSSLVRHYMKCGIKYFSLVKIFSGHTAPVRWWDGGCPGRAAARDLWWCGRRAQHSTLQPYFHHYTTTTTIS